jgi:hypothetical protein
MDEVEGKCGVPFGAEKNSEFQISIDHKPGVGQRLDLQALGVNLMRRRIWHTNVKAPQEHCPTIRS